MILSQHKVYVDITRKNYFLNNFRSFYNGYPVMNNPFTILPVSHLPFTLAILQVGGIHLFIGHICRLFSTLTLQDQLIQKFYTHWILARFMALYAYNLWAPFFYRKSANSLYLYMSRKFDCLGLVFVSLFGFTVSIFSYIFTSISTTFGTFY